MEEEKEIKEEEVLEEKVVCCNCGIELTENMENTGADNEIYCDDCFNDIFSECDDCNTLEVRDNLIYLNNLDIHICQSCLDNYTQCDDCDDWFNGDECPNNDCRCIIHEYTYKPRPLFYETNISKTENNNKKLFLGFELEVECEKRNRDNTTTELLKNATRDTIYLKHDSTLDYGFEIVSHPHTLEMHYKRTYENMFKYLKDNECKSHDTTTCGMHVHINKSFLTHSERAKIAMLVYNNWDKFKEIARRDSVDYAKKKNARNGKEIIDAIYGWDRYEAVNYRNHNTIEFRLFKGTLKYSTFMATLEIVDAICKFVKEINVMDLRAEKDSWTPFVNWIKKQNYKYILNYIGELKICA